MPGSVHWVRFKNSPVRKVAAKSRSGITGLTAQISLNIKMPYGMSPPEAQI